MFKTIQVHIKGAAPILLHNGHTADPMNPFSRAKKEISGKRKKTDADHEEIARIEFQAGFYADELGRPVIPGEVIEATMINAAKKLKLGQQAKSAIFSSGLWPLIYKGPKTITELLEDPTRAFWFTTGVRIQQSRVMLTRPIFRDWELKFEISVNDESMNFSEIKQILDIAGTQIGLCDYRPKYGRFIVQSVK